MNTKLKTFKKFNEAVSSVTASELKSAGIENYMFFENLKSAAGVSRPLCFS